MRHRLVYLRPNRVIVVEIARGREKETAAEG